MDNQNLRKIKNGGGMMQAAPLSSTRDEIISNLFTCSNFNDCLSKMEPAHLREDLKQEVALIVCEWPEERIIRYHTAKALEFYVVRVILNQIQSNTSPFYRKYRQFKLSFDSIQHRVADDHKEEGLFSLIDEGAYTKSEIQFMANHELKLNDSGEEDPESRRTREELEDYTLEQIDNLQILTYYESEMIKLYMEAGSYRAMFTATQIPHPSCFKTVQKALEKLRKHVGFKHDIDKKPEPIFNKSELNFIQNGKNETGD